MPQHTPRHPFHATPRRASQVRVLYDQACRAPSEATFVSLQLRIEAETDYTYSSIAFFTTGHTVRYDLDGGGAVGGATYFIYVSDDSPHPVAIQLDGAALMAYREPRAGALPWSQHRYDAARPSLGLPVSRLPARQMVSPC